MQATVRLYLNLARTALVLEGDPEGATLYAAPGDEIPASAVERFGLVDGTIGGVVLVQISDDDLIRVRLIDAGPLNFLEIDDLVFSADYRGIVDDQIDEGQLLSILKETRLDVLAARLDTSPVEFVPFPGRARAVELLQERIDDDIANGRPHLRCNAATPAAKEAPPPPNKERAPGQDKERVPGEDKGAGSGTKGDAAAAPAADDLAKLKFVGAKSAAALVAAGFATFAQVAAIDPASPPAITGLGAATNWAGIVASAKEIVAKAAPVAAATDGDQGAGTASGDGGAGTDGTDQVGA